MILAEKTLNAINAALEKDQGAEYRRILRFVLPKIEDAYREEDDGFRAHLGSSIIGGDCARRIWYGFHWIQKSHFKGQILRLFNRGHLEEGRFLSLLLMIGITVYQQDDKGNQLKISKFNGHFGGSLDGVGIGIPDMDPNEPALLEFKTHNDRSFNELVKKGMAKAKPEHNVQMQLYMHNKGLARGLYGGTNKNDDHLHLEIVEYNRAIAISYENRASMILAEDKPPARINSSPSFYKCKMCEYQETCFSKKDTKVAISVNCRSCSHSRPNPEPPEKTWICEKHNRLLSVEDQRIGCNDHTIRDLV